MRTFYSNRMCVHTTACEILQAEMKVHLKLIYNLYSVYGVI